MRRYHGLRRGILILNVDGEALDEDMECELEDNDRVNEQDVDMSKEDTAKKILWKRQATPLSAGTEKDKMRMADTA